MKISREEVIKVAALARLSYPEEELDKFVGQMNQILVYMEKLNTLDTRAVEPTSHVVELETPLREDEVLASLSLEDALANAPDQAEGCVRAPKIIGGEP